jgi:hypothetical protein
LDVLEKKPQELPKSSAVVNIKQYKIPGRSWKLSTLVNEMVEEEC